MGIEFFKHIYFRLPIVVRLLLSILILMTFFGTVIHFIEPKEFPTIFDGVWWAFVTGATVGYGDYIPLTTTGRVVGILLILSGGGLLTFYISHISAGTVQHEQDLSKGRVAYKGKKHIILIGWNERSRQFINMMMEKGNKGEIVLIDRTLKHLPYNKLPVHFIHGDASEDGTLNQANIQEALSVIITSNSKQKERDADINTILTTVAIRGNNKNVPIIAEILSKSQVENALRAGANTTIGTNDFMSTLFYHEVFNPHTTKIVETILHLLKSQHFTHQTLPEELVEKSYGNGVNYYLQKHFLLVGIIRNGEWKINPQHDYMLERGDILLTLSSWE